MSDPNITYIREFYTAEKSVEIYYELFKLPFENICLEIHDRTYNPQRKTYSYGDPDVFYTYSGQTNHPKPWTIQLLELKADVEQETGFTYNYVLLNFYENGQAAIGVHKDNETSLDTTIPIPTLSFGACRNMLFSKKGEKSISQPLENGSLLTMYDQNWFHAIPPEPEITESYISLTFHNISIPRISSELSIKHSLDDWDREYGIKTNRTKKLHIDPTFQQPPAEIQNPQDVLMKQDTMPRPPDISTDMTIQDIPENDYWLTQFIHHTENRILKKFGLGQDVYASLQLYKKQLYVDIRHYDKKPNSDILIPTKNGVYLDMPTFYDLTNKIFAICLKYSSECTLFNNCILGIVKDNTLQLRQFNGTQLNTHFVELSREQFKSLKFNVCDIEKYILNYLFCERLQEFVCDSRPYQAESMKSGFFALKRLVEENIRFHLLAHYKCAGCIFDSLSQNIHECILLSSAEKYRAVGESIRLLTQVDSIASEYLKSYPKLSKDIDFERLYVSLFSD